MGKNSRLEGYLLSALSIISSLLSGAEAHALLFTLKMREQRTCEQFDPQ